MSTAATCPYAHLDAVYVLGALAATERVEYERHLPGCVECTRALRELAGMPGLLGRVSADDVGQVEHTAPPVPVPATLLPAVVARARRSQRRRRALTASLVAAAVAVLVALAGIGLSLREDEPPTATPQRMESLGTASSGWVAFTERRWGTQIDLTCTYEGRIADRTTYVLVVRSADGRSQQVGTWRSERGQEVHVTMATSVATDDIASVEVRTEDGYSVLRLEE
ncbi:hypothetical protein FHP29_03535 [Nocardioides albidus]|uniref:Zf-HC2 domain-containing protein n=1 Tax=Nocardioides albidus TaxID=1517589 RepID=A0A5C4WEW8_9ACTN|nr:hypothetical protein [Nocardioides albidus]TNM46025.1 hypothetical protein FHP29_03535 [Nocardioides albidus]